MKLGIHGHDIAAALLVCGGFLVLIASIIWSPLALVASVAGAALVICAFRFGLLTTAVLLGLSAMALSAFIGRYISAANVLNSVGTAIVIAVGIAVFPYVRLPKSVVVPALGFLGLATASMLHWMTISPEYAFRGWIALVAAPLTVVAVAGTIQRVKELTPDRVGRTWKPIVVALALITVLNLVLGMKQSLLGLDGAESRSATQGDSTYLVGDQIRIMGAFLTNQDMGLFLACFSPAALALGMTLKGRASKWAYIVSALLYITTFLSLTRTALIAAILVGVFAFIFIGGGEFVWRLIKNLILAAVGLACIWLFLAALEVERVNDAITRALTLFDLSNDGSFNSRADATLPIAWRHFQENFLGAGVGSAGPVSAQFFDVAPMGYVNSDNGYLNAAIQLGIFGVVAFVWFLIALTAHLAKKKTAWTSAAAAAVLALIVAMLTAGYWSLLAPICVISALVGLGVAELIPPRAYRQHEKSAATRPLNVSDP